MLQTTTDKQMILQQQTSAELDVQIATAKKYPRDEKRSIESSKKSATVSKDVASSCTYTLPRAGKNITGPSIRLAEIVGQAWGNLHAATRIISNDGKYITTQAVAWDLESNTRFNVENRKKITDKNGRVFNEDLQVLTANASASIALRNAIFKAIPKSIIYEVYNHAMIFLAGNSNANGNSDFSSKVENCINTFIDYGYTENEILKFLNRKSKNEMTKDDLIMMHGIVTRIREGDVEIEKALSVNEDEEQQNSHLEDI